ncbi:MAG: hypothetical protein AB2A00_35945 [Myxococcota bacterium]
MRHAWLLLALVLPLGASPAFAHPQPASVSTTRAAAKPRPKPKRKPPKKRPRKKTVVPPEQAEQALHAERLAVVTRLRDVNRDLKDAELAATVERLEEKERKRHELVLKVLAAEAAKAAEDKK